MNLTAILHRLQHALILATGIAAVVLAGMWSPVAGAMLLLVEGLALALALRRGYFRVPVQAAPAESNPEADAKNMVTHLLKLLTRVQVAYLCRSFPTQEESRAWLRRSLPKGFLGSLDELHRSLERARLGSEVPSVRLAQRIAARREDLRRLERDLERAARDHDGYSVAHPMIFVVTEHLSATGDAEPAVTTLAGWDPTAPTLLPRVDTITIYSDLDAGKSVRGQAAFGDVLAALPGTVRPVEPGGAVFLADAVEDPGRLGVHLERVPLGFTVELT